MHVYDRWCSCRSCYEEAMKRAIEKPRLTNQLQKTNDYLKEKMDDVIRAQLNANTQLVSTVSNISASGSSYHSGTGTTAHSIVIYDPYAAFRETPNATGDWSINYIQLLNKEANMATSTQTFTKERLWFLYSISNGSSCFFETKEEAAAQAEQWITADKSLRFAIGKISEMVEAEPVKTRVTPLK